MSVFQEKVLDRVREALDGNVVQIPVHLERVNDVLSIRKNLYTLVGGNTGSGKTSFVDDTYVLKPYTLWQQFKDQTDITFRSLYRSMERSQGDKLAKWACWKLHQDHGFLIDSDTLLGYRKNRISEEVWDLIVASREWADELLDYVDIRDGRTTPNELNEWVTGHALRNGNLFVTDGFGLKHLNTNKDTYQLTFHEHGEDKQLKSGDIVRVIRFNFEGKVRELKADEKLYIPWRNKEITTVISDHLGKFNGDPGQSSKKAIVDKASEYNSDFRDVFGYSPVAISQFNRAIGDTQRMKFADGDLAPQIEDFKDSAGSQEDADLILALFDAFRYKSYDANGMYRGYNIRDKMVNAYGYNRYRLLAVLKNSYGRDSVSFGLKFLGEVNDFKTLPKPDDELALQREYELISKGF